MKDIEITLGRTANAKLAQHPPCLLTCAGLEILQIVNHSSQGGVPVLSIPLFELLTNDPWRELAPHFLRADDWEPRSRRFQQGNAVCLSVRSMEKEARSPERIYDSVSWYDKTLRSGWVAVSTDQRRVTGI